MRISKLRLRKTKTLNGHNPALGFRLSSPCISLLLCETALSKGKGNIISLLYSIEKLEMLCNTPDIFCGVKENYWSVTVQNLKTNKQVLSADWNAEFTFELCLHNPYILCCICWIQSHAMSQTISLEELVCNLYWFQLYRIKIRTQLHKYHYKFGYIIKIMIFIFVAYCRSSIL